MSEDAWDFEPSRAACTTRDDDGFFFPSAAFMRGRADSDRFVRRSYSQALRRMDEPTLSCKPPNDETLRLLVLPTWGPPLAIRVNLGAAPAVTVVELDGNGGYDPGRKARTLHRAIRPLDAEAIRAAARSADFWNLPVNDYSRTGEDGTQWVMEFRSGTRYRAVHRWVPLPGAFRSVAEAIAKAAGERLPRGQPEPAPSSR